MMKQLRYMVVCALLLSALLPMRAQNNPYVDEKLIHFGFSLGMDFMSYNVTEQEAMVQQQLNGAVDSVFHARSSAAGLGAAVGFIADLRLTRHLNLRFCPGMHFGSRMIEYKALHDSMKIVSTQSEGRVYNKPQVLCLPIDLPLYLKWSAEREVNYRPYIIAGGGVSFDVGRDKQRVLLQKKVDYFVEVGFGCDFYFRWFKFCPELRYRIGLRDVLTPVSACEEEGWELSAGDYFYTNAIEKMTNQQISLIFNFE